MKIAVTMPGLNGDALYSLPTVRHISKIFGTKVDFWTSKLCAPILSLVKNQSYINDAFIAQKYVPQHSNCGVQPFQLQPEGEYDKVFMLGLREYPKCRLVDYFPQIYGLTMVDKTIEYDYLERGCTQKPYSVVVSPGRNPALKGYFANIMTELSKGFTIAQIGPSQELINLNLPNVNNYDIDMLETLGFMADAKLFVGTLSANLVLANGFRNLKKVILVEPERHNESHDIKSSYHMYVEPQKALEAIKAISAITRSPLDV